METELNLSSSINMNHNHDSNVTGNHYNHTTNHGVSSDQPSLQLPTPDLVDEDDSDVPRVRRGGRRKIDIEYIKDKSRRHITFSKRKAGIMKKAYELSTLTGTQVLLLVVSETGLVYTFTTPKLQPMVTNTEGKNLIQNCLNAPDEDKEERRSVTSEPEPEPQSNHHHLAPSNTNSNPDDNLTKRIVHNEAIPVTSSAVANPTLGYLQVSYGLPPPSTQQQQHQPQQQQHQHSLEGNYSHPGDYHHPNGSTPYSPTNPVPSSNPPPHPHGTYPAPPHHGNYSGIYVTGITTDQPTSTPTNTTSPYPNQSGYVNHTYPVPHHPTPYPPPHPGVHPYYPPTPTYPPPTTSTPCPPPYSYPPPITNLSQPPPLSLYPPPMANPPTPITSHPHLTHPPY